ncbi:hypothetical protein OQJ18_10000 [Fluoribacter dumoffii]|uniref:Uncharacterized protein n=1 Tax=Fluoribacter dumoffii TaxID=463 RepID=A0A377G6K2_9GAMM|nr:hypothetical protein [Fluoribacter dumoffii]KTC89316.1 hypothetical protein Ldum_0384 [Fluoribacter dumoffii NY 23]MCW8386925.1 hypothetical protein [Fluoribacter dumoffii]MCW8417571.1 hypothetical protein [Fluoribacter dumoffii]MCW8454588.1 hypothetical protein [Fluoribacter dumoffii]MCW8461336.1 hypothetical protein [Fluoribacter dumoffii]
MRSITIKVVLDKYDESKGPTRIYLKEESNIKKLRFFYESLKDRILSSSSLLELAHILLGKKTRTHLKESGKAFEKLANMLGGFEALDILNSAKQLTKENIEFLEQHPTEGKALAPLMVSLSKNTRVPETKIFAAMEKIKNPQEFITVFKELVSIAQTDHAQYFINALTLLNTHNLNTDEVLPLLKDAEHILFVNQVLITLAEINPSLITLPNLVNIVKIKSLEFHKLLENLCPDQKFLDILFQAEKKLSKEQYFWFESLCNNFKKAGWDLYPFLPTILGGEIDFFSASAATAKLIKLAVKPEHLSLMLHTIFAHSNESMEFVNAVESLQKEGLDEDFFKLESAPEFARELAYALIALQQAKCYEVTAKIYISLNPKYALGLAQFWIQFSKTECPIATLRPLMLKNPQCASYTAGVIEFLRKHELHNEKNISTICHAKLTNHALLNLLNLMHEEKILNETSLDLVLSNLAFTNTLYSGAKCLANSKKLDISNFDALICDPVNALAMAEYLGGKPYPPSYPSLINRGAQDFAIIRKNTKLLCQGYRQGLFFPEMSTEQKDSFEKGRRRPFAETQKEIIIKIAQYTGNQELEEEVERNIAQNALVSLGM